jgi:hypothetical protein
MVSNKSVPDCDVGFDDDLLVDNIDSSGTVGIQEIDPEFYEYLRNHDEGLLNFIDEELHHADDYNAVLVDDTSHVDERHDRIELTMEFFRKTASKAMKGSVVDIRRMITMLKTALSSSSSSSQGGMSLNHRNSEVMGEIINRSFLIACCGFTSVFSSTTTSSSSFKRSISSNDLINHKQWKITKPLILRLLRIFVEGFPSLNADHRHYDSILFHLSNLQYILPFALPFTKMIKSVFQIVIRSWIGSLDQQQRDEDDIDQKGESEDEESEEISEKDEKERKNRSSSSFASVDSTKASRFALVREESFNRLKQFVDLLLKNSSPLIEVLFKDIYLQFARTCRFVNSETMVLMDPIIKGIIELYKLDIPSAYQQGFLYVRQLALYLRLAFLKKSEKTMKIIKSYQYLLCINLWSKAVSLLSVPSSSDYSGFQNSNEDGLGMLAFPIIQIILGTMKLLQSPYYLPLKLHLFNSLQFIAAACSLFIPLSAYYLEIIDQLTVSFSHNRSHHSKQFNNPMNFQIRKVISLPVNSLNSNETLNLIIKELMFSICCELEVYKFSCGFPEYFYPLLRKLKLFLKDVKEQNPRDYVKAVIQRIQHEMRLRKSGRTTPQEAERSGFEALLPPGKPNASRRLERTVLVENKIMSPEFQKPAEKSNVRESKSVLNEDFLKKKRSINKKVDVSAPKRVKKNENRIDDTVQALSFRVSK